MKNHSKTLKMWELLQIVISRLNFKNVGTITNCDFTVQLRKCGNYYKLRFHGSTLKMWELLQIAISRFNFKTVGTITNCDFTVQL
ncbi:hypothetical protein LEP1GSC170_3921 [Leptospira interrogans serovar Bataviae str. HAI135]|nr:hypothetical protein LEP1GSC170_3921 [Leptospira interrogans serovar Bataviae str. HAI135]